jgi:hypothetical protein
MYRALEQRAESGTRELQTPVFRRTLRDQCPALAARTSPPIGAATRSPAWPPERVICVRPQAWRTLDPAPDSADVSEFPLRILMHRSASAFVISNAVCASPEHWYPSSGWARSPIPGGSVLTNFPNVARTDRLVLVLYDPLTRGCQSHPCPSASVPPMLLFHWEGTCPRADLWRSGPLHLQNGRAGDVGM